MTKCKISPVEFNVVVELDAREEKTAGGIILTTKTTDADELASDEGTLVAVSPMAFSYAEWPEGERKPQVGDRVLFKRYEGILRKGKDGEPSHRIFSDKAIMAVVEPASVPLAAVA